MFSVVSFHKSIRNKQKMNRLFFIVILFISSLVFVIECAGTEIDFNFDLEEVDSKFKAVAESELGETQEKIDKNLQFLKHLLESEFIWFYVISP